MTDPAPRSMPPPAPVIRGASCGAPEFRNYNGEGPSSAGAAGTVADAAPIQMPPPMVNVQDRQALLAFLQSNPPPTANPLMLGAAATSSGGATDDDDHMPSDSAQSSPTDSYADDVGDVSPALDATPE